MKLKAIVAAVMGAVIATSAVANVTAS